MITMYCITGGDVLSPGAPLSSEGCDALKRLIRGSQIGRIKHFDCVVAWPNRAAEVMAGIIAPKAQKIIRLNELEPENTYRADWARYRKFRESQPAPRMIAGESMANASLFACLAMHIEEQLTSILATTSEDAKVGVIVLPHPLAGIMFAHAMKASPMWTFRQGDTFMVNFNREGRVCDPSPRLIEVPPA